MAIRRECFDASSGDCCSDLINGAGWFPGVHKSAKFCLYAAKKGSHTDGLRVAFGIRSQGDLLKAFAEKNPVRLSPSVVRSFSPEALAIMEISSPADLTLATRMHGAWPAFGSGEGLQPQHKHMRELDMDKRQLGLSRGVTGACRVRGADGPAVRSPSEGVQIGESPKRRLGRFPLLPTVPNVQPQSTFVRATSRRKTVGTTPFYLSRRLLQHR